MGLPDGLTINLAIHNRSGNMVWLVEMTEEYLTRSVISVLEERIKRAEVALKVCKHTKRKHRLTKLYKAMVEFHQEQTAKLQQLLDEDIEVV